MSLVNEEAIILENLLKNIHYINSSEFEEYDIPRLHRILSVYVSRKNQTYTEEEENCIINFLKDMIKKYRTYSTLFFLSFDFSNFNNFFVSFSDVDLSDLNLNLIKKPLIKTIGNLVTKSQQNDILISQQNVKIEHIEENQIKNQKIIDELIQQNDQLLKMIQGLKEILPNPNQGNPGQMLVLNQDNSAFRFETVPNSISFHAYLDKYSYPIDRSNWKIIPLNSVLYDSNKSFDMKYHFYSIPIKGMWNFIGKVFFHNEENRNLLSLRFTKNDKIITEISNYHKEEKNWEAISDGFVCECDVGDRIQLQTYHYKNLKSGIYGTYLQGRYLGPI